MQQSVAEVKQEIYNRMASIVAEPRARYTPGANKRVDELVAELRRIAATRPKGQPFDPRYRERLSEILTELHLDHGISQAELAGIAGINRQHISNYINKSLGEKKYFDEEKLEKPEDKESLLAELRKIREKKIGGTDIPNELKPRLSEIITKLHHAHGISINQISQVIDMDRNIVASYMHVYTGPEIRRELPFAPGPNPAKKVWWKKSGKSYKDLWAFAQDISGVFPVRLKKDYRDIAVEAVNYINAGDEVKDPLLEFIKSAAFKEFQSATGYRPMVQFPIQFIQWLSEIRGREITLSDLDQKTRDHPTGINTATGDDFIDDYVPEKRDPENPEAGPQRSETSMAHIRAALKKFFEYAAMTGYVTFPMVGMKTKMPREIAHIVYTNYELDEFFNKILTGRPVYYSLFIRLILQTGSRPGQLFEIKCKDTDFGTPVQDVYGKAFYPINTGDILVQYKERRGEQVRKKYAPGTAFISESVWKDLKEWCTKNNLAANDYIFKKFISLNGIQSGIRDRVYILSGYKNVNDQWVKDPLRKPELKHGLDFYVLKGMRHTNASVRYNLTLNPKYVTEAGGWASTSSVSTDVYSKMMKIKPAYDVFRKWEIYIDTEIVTASGKPFKMHIKEIEAGLEGAEKAAPAAGAISADEVKRIFDMVEKQQEEMVALRKQIEDLRKP